MKLFGTDGIRGIANRFPMSVDVALKVGKALTHLLSQQRDHPRILVGKDTRLSGYMFETALVAGICSMGGEAILIGPLPTPGIAFLVRDMKADAGIVISASHNPFYDNGIKIFGPDGYKLPDELEGELERMVLEEGFEDLGPTGDRIGRAMRMVDALGRYLVFLKKTLPQDLDLKGLRIVLDCANGAAYRIAPMLFWELGAEVITLGTAPNGTNINDGCGALYPEKMARAVVAYGADMGLALDGDGDRVVLSDRRGQILDGDRILAICALQMADRGILKGNAVVATVMSNMGLDIALSRRGIRVLRTKVGDRYVVEEMKRGGYNLGGEQAGHIVFLDHTTTGDGLLTALQVIGIMRETGRDLSELAEVMTPLPQVRRDLRVSRKPPLEDIPGFLEAFREAEEALDGRGRVLVRYSGTEPVLRIMVEGEDRGQIEEMADRLYQIAKGHIGEGGWR
ncbi:MAG: phosphoglucosamine mutase [Deltaproteobacteria bacterium]|nr:MAG: phosphoglucosamine mutase [Deltaproteobacteria bacterium]